MSHKRLAVSNMWSKSWNQFQWQPTHLSWDFLETQLLLAIALSCHASLSSFPPHLLCIGRLLGLIIWKPWRLLIPSCLIFWSSKLTTQNVSTPNHLAPPVCTFPYGFIFLPESISHYSPPSKICAFRDFKNNSTISSISSLIFPPVSCLNWNLVSQEQLSHAFLPNGGLLFQVSRLTNGVRVPLFPMLFQK